MPKRIASLLLLGSLSALAQVSPTAYRVLGQPDLRRNGVNQVQGEEFRGPGGLALDPGEGRPYLYVADSRNHRILGWRNARTFQNGEAAELVLGQPDLRQVTALGIGVKGLNQPNGAAVDPATGNLYVADTGNHRVLRFARPFANPGRVEPDAVYGQPDFESRAPNAGGLSSRSLSAPGGVAVDAAGHLWVADSGNHRVLRFPAWTLEAPEPTADLVIGQPDFVSGAPNQGVATSASGFDTPVGVALDRSGNLYVSDFNNARVLKFLAPAGSNPAAVGVWGQSTFTARGVPGRVSGATMAGPMGLAVGRAGNLYVAVPHDNRVLVFAAEESQREAKAVLGQPDVETVLPNAGVHPQASASTLSGVADVKVDAEGTVYVADAGNHRVLCFQPNSTTAARLLGQADFRANGANRVKPVSLNGPYKMAVDYSQQPFPLYVSDTNNHRVLGWRDSARFRSGAAADFVIGQIDLYTAAPNADSRGGGAPTAASLSFPKGLAADASGNLWVADSGNHRLLRFPKPNAQTGRIRADVVLGQAEFTSAVSAAVGAASLRDPAGVTIGPGGNLFVADSGNHRVLEFASGAGTGAAALRVYGQPAFFTSVAPAAVSAQTLSAPQGLAVDGAHNLYVADYGANRVLVFPNTRDAPPAGASAAIVVGQPSFDFAQGGTGAARLRGPADVALDGRDWIYVSDFGNNRVLVFPSLVNLPIAGAAALGALGQRTPDGVAPNWNSRDGLATPEGLAAPLGLLVDRRGTLYVGDAGNSRVLHFLKPAALVNAAHFQGSVPVARGTLVSLFGVDMAEDAATAPAAPFPMALAGREVLINDEVKAPLSSVGKQQINLQVPSAAPLGAQRLAVRVQESAELLAGAPVSVAAAAPGLFTLSQDGRGQGAILNQDGTPNGPSHPAARGSVVQVFGTGQGPVSPAVEDGQAAPASPLASTVAVPTSDGAACLGAQPAMCVAIGATFGEVRFSGLAPGYVGLWQINVRIPDKALTGNAIPLRAVVNGAPSNTVTVAIN